ncbi:RidA family protein [Sphingobium rhizovicinum]|uniref:RidA family protein n=1 Tax=Sphingobium rhizovicinum TaxID=432308 RepID=A0ABV7NH17_9SPHN
MTELETIETGDAPAPAGHYAQAIRVNGMLYVSGQLPVEVDRTVRSDLAFEDQVRLAMANALAILKAGGCGPDRIARVTAYIVGVDNWPRFNMVYAQMLGDARPARTVVPVTELHHGCLVEIDAIGAPAA